MTDIHKQVNAARLADLFDAIDSGEYNNVLRARPKPKLNKCYCKAFGISDCDCDK